jgi:putative endonuclease
MKAIGIAIASGSRMLEATRFVYVLKSAEPMPHFYIGLSADVRARLADHNAGRCPHTARHGRWQLHVTIELQDEQRAVDFERYLKSRSGRAFAKRHFG